jgi:hypothetical protein
MRGDRMPKGMEWEDPPPVSRYRWNEVAEELKTNPGEWLKVFDEGPVSVANAIRQGEVSTLTPVRPNRRKVTHEGFEVRTRNNDAGPPRVCTLYLRWVEEGE